MCYGCWEEAGKPTAGLAALAVVPLIAQVYDFSAVGGSLHIVLDDYNVEADHIEFCLSLPDITSAERACGVALLALSEEQRVAAIAAHDGFTDGG